MDELRDRAGDLVLLPACNFADSSMCERRYGSYGEILTHGGWIYVCMCICMCMCMYVYTYVCMYVSIHTYIYYIYIYIYIYI